MIYIPGKVIAVLTFPGIVMQTLARRFWCDILKIPVYEAQYFKGIIIHEKIESPGRAALVAFAPITVNSILSAVLLFPLTFSIFLESSVPGQNGIINFFLIWVGFSIGFHALPSRETISAYLENYPKHKISGMGYFFMRATGVVFTLIDVLKIFWIDLIYVILISAAAPYLITRIYMILI